MVDRNMSLKEFRATRHAEINIYLMLMKVEEKFRQGRNTPEGEELGRQHYLYLWELEEAGKLLGCGPRDRGEPSHEGMGILLVDSREEAEEIARNEPFGKAGWRTNRVATWQLNEGPAVALAREIIATKKKGA